MLKAIGYADVGWARSSGVFFPLGDDTDETDSYCFTSILLYGRITNCLMYASLVVVSVRCYWVQITGCVMVTCCESRVVAAVIPYGPKGPLRRFGWFSCAVVCLLPGNTLPPNYDPFLC